MTDVERRTTKQRQSMSVYKTDYEKIKIVAGILGYGYADLVEELVENYLDSLSDEDLKLIKEVADRQNVEI